MVCVSAAYACMCLIKISVRSFFGSILEQLQTGSSNLQAFKFIFF